MGIVMGIDIGQQRDPTALAVAESEERLRIREPVKKGNAIVRWREVKEMHYMIRYLERLPLGTPYPGVADRLAEVVASLKKKIGRGPSHIFVDATGVGRPVVDLLQEKVSSHVVAVTFTHGDRRVEHSYQEVTLGKMYLVSRLKTLLQTSRIHLPKTSEADALAQELLDYEIRVDQNANDTYGAFKVGSHDDLVTALGLAVQVDPIRPMIGRATLQGAPTQHPGSIQNG